MVLGLDPIPNLTIRPTPPNSPPRAPFPYNAPMKVVMVSKALIVGAYQRKAEEIARPGVDLTVLIPPSWRDRRGEQQAEFAHTAGYDLRILPLRMNGNYHLHFYPTLAEELQRISPDIVHFDEEPYNLATWLGLNAAWRVGAQATFFTWQNIQRTYPPPFRWMERANYRRVPVAIAGNQDASDVLRAKGYRGQIEIIPQFGVDPEIFAPRPSPPGPRPFQIGYAGGLIEEKGLDTLLQACAGLTGEWTLRLVGGGDQAKALSALADRLGVAERVQIGERLISTEMPHFYRSLDALVLPSRTRPNWKEQFGRVLIEAMSCQVPVVGSNSGEIPHVIGGGKDRGGLIFPEGDSDHLRRHLQRLMDDPNLAHALGQAGRQRVLNRYTMGIVASRTVDVYWKLLSPYCDWTET